MNIAINFMNKVLFLGLLTFSVANASEATDLLNRSYPNLNRLYQSYPKLHQQLSGYATMQGYQSPIENLATVVHELIHIDSNLQNGYYMNGSYYEPYMSSQQWPFLSNKDIDQNLTQSDIKALGIIHSEYLRNTPQNTLANILDEINAYTQTIPFICQNDPERSSPHLNALSGHVALVDIYLRVLASTQPEQYRKLSGNRIARGALETIVANAYKTLNQCYAMHIPAADPRPIPKSYTKAFANHL